MSDGMLSMSVSERERASIMRQIDNGTIPQRVAAERLGMCVRQVGRLYRAWRYSGDAGLVSRQRGRVSPLRLDANIRRRIEELLTSEYPDFGATLASEKLAERQGIVVSRETVRRIQIELGMAKPKRRKAKRAHPPRQRRPRFGELVQVDGSSHDWFEGRGPRCTLIVFIDDAISRLTALFFQPSETTYAYMEALRAHTLAHGLPLALYSDRHGIFRVNAKEAESGDGLTEFGRVAERLRIELIQAKSAQAKGRVERANLTCQDRLIKDMRLEGISTIAEAQAYTSKFIAMWNKKFAKAPLVSEDAHRPWTKSVEALDEVMARRQERTLSKNLTFSLDGKLYCVDAKGPGLAMRNTKITLLHYRDGTMRVRWKDRFFGYTHFKTNYPPIDAEDEKTIDARMDSIVARAALEGQNPDILTLR